MTPSSRARLAGLALLAALCGAAPAGAEPIKGMPEATVPLPPPLPPARPEGLVPGPPEAEPEIKPEARPDATPEPPSAGRPQAPPPLTPLPPERPPELTAPPSGGPGSAPGPEAPAARPEAPAARPEAPAARPEAPLPPARPPELSGEAALALTVSAPDDTACLRRLERLGARFAPAAPLASGQCSAPRPLTVTALADGIALEPAATLTCGAAEALARWTTEVQAAAQRELGEGLSSLALGGTYVCRGQNHDTDAKLSEHSFANAIDVMGYGFAKRGALKVTAATAGTPEAAFLAATRTSACRFFRTVLGPGSDAAHGNHLHLDERERTAGHRLCQ